MAPQPISRPAPAPDDDPVAYLLCRASECGWRLPYDRAQLACAEKRRALHEQFCAHL